MKKKIFSLVISLLLVLGLFPVGVAAQTPDPEGVTVSPIFSEFELAPAQSDEFTVSIRNNETVDVKCSVGFGEITEKTDGSGEYELKRLDKQTVEILSPEAISFTVKAGETYLLPVKVTMPMDPVEASYFPVILVGVDPGNTNEFSSQGEIASIVYLNLKEGTGTGDEGSQFGFDVNPYMKIKLEVIKKIVPFPFNTFKVTIQNTGKTYIKPFGNIVVLDPKNTKLKDIPVNEKLKILLPNQTLEAEYDWQQYAPNDILSYLIPRFGKYTAALGAVSGERGERAQETFWVIPYYHILLILILGSYTAYRLSKRKLKHRRES